MYNRISAIPLAILITAASLAIAGCGGPPDLATMVEEVKGGVVRIETFDGGGSGFIFGTTGDDAALVLTNYHVVEDAIRIRVIVDDTVSYRGHLQGYDVQNDLAVLSICCGDFKSLSFGKAADLKTGSEVVAIGYPLDIPGAPTVTRGIVSAIRSEGYSEIIQMDAPINPGNSGGPLLSPSGKVLGVNTFSLRNAQGLGFAISERSVRAVLPEIRGGRNLAAAATPPVASMDYFTIGSTTDELLNIQGKPTQVERISSSPVYADIVTEVWWYEDDTVSISELIGDHKVVVSWSNYGRKLRVRLLPNQVPTKTSGYFTVGSTQSDVLNIHGAPDSILIDGNRESREGWVLWFYGNSIVQFSYPIIWVLDESGILIPGSLTDQSGQVLGWTNEGNLKVQ